MRDAYQLVDELLTAAATVVLFWPLAATLKSDTVSFEDGRKWRSVLRGVCLLLLAHEALYALAGLIPAIRVFDKASAMAVTDDVSEWLTFSAAKWFPTR